MTLQQWIDGNEFSAPDGEYDADLEGDAYTHPKADLSVFVSGTVVYVNDHAGTRYDDDSNEFIDMINDGILVAR